jgi:MFS family permease
MEGAELRQRPRDPNQLALLAQRRFAPLFRAQFLGAGNENPFNFAFTVMVSCATASVAGIAPGLVVQRLAALFILPFLLFSATSGQIADKSDKARLIRWVKTREIGIMLLALYGFTATDTTALLGCTFLLGLHSTLFGPLKWAYLPQHLDERELTGGNGMVEVGTFVAILLGNVVGGLLIGIPEVAARATWPGAASRPLCSAASRRSSCPARRPPMRASRSTGTQ